MNNNYIIENENDDIFISYQGIKISYNSIGYQLPQDEIIHKNGLIKILTFIKIIRRLIINLYEDDIILSNDCMEFL